MVLTWTDEQLAATIWLGFTFGPWMVIEGWVRWHRLLDRISVAGAALASLVGGATPLDLLETGNRADNASVWSSHRAVHVDGVQGDEARSTREDRRAEAV